MSDIIEYKRNDVNDNPHKRFYDKKWNFKDYSMKELVHGLHPYPAMMMPLIARTMFAQYGKKERTVFFDPYVGSGTTLVEAQLYGAKKAIGIDLNPLAILISRTKTEAVNLQEVRQKIDEFDDYMQNVGDVEAPSFPIRDSWFNPQVVNDLAKIRNFILQINDSTVLDFFKTSFSEVVRASSETRNGEFKLYRMSQTSLEKFDPHPIALFKEVIDRNFRILQRVDYRRNTEIELYNDNVLDIYRHDSLNNAVDLIITSPPYGDSHTTVAYGQFSRLSNEWLGIKNAGTLDRRLLGGRRVVRPKFNIPELDDAINQIQQNDKNFNRERAWEVVSFYHDYQKSIEAIVPTVKRGGYVIFVVGNRRVRNVELALDVITYKMFEQYGFSHEITHVRDIINKRMPLKASPVDSVGGQIPTMTQEYIVVMKKI
ncbi:MAG: hypothetical protein NC548_58185 [Lachnospiraceae bacterium]|nr:hypothetical protein [Lachnospiraceae bacterium]